MKNTQNPQTAHVKVKQTKINREISHLTEIGIANDWLVPEGTVAAG